MGESSYNGWPVIRDEAGIRTVNSHGRTFRVAAGTEHYWQAFLDEYHDTVEDFTGGQLDDWSYVIRLTRGSSTSISCHSSATAVDLDALQHPRGRKGTFTGRELTALRTLLKRFPAIKWGGDFSTVVDEMHFELKHPSTAKPIIARFVYIAPEVDDMTAQFEADVRYVLEKMHEDIRGYGARVERVEALLDGYGPRIENAERLADETRNRVIGVLPETLDQLRDSILDGEVVVVTNPYTDAENTVNIRTALGRAASVVSNAETREKRETITPATAPIKRA